MSNEVTVVNEWGEGYTLDMLRDKAAISKISTEDLEHISYMLKSLKNPIKNIETEIKDRLDNGVQFKDISYTKYQKKIIKTPSNEKLRELVIKYGWGVVSINTPKQLTDRFGEVIIEDIEDLIVYDTQERVKYER